MEPPPEDPKAAKGRRSKKHFWGGSCDSAIIGSPCRPLFIAAAVVVAVASLALTPVGGRMHTVPLA